MCLKNIIQRCETFGEDKCREYFVLTDYSLPLSKKVNPPWRLCFRRKSIN